jgi:hypothetical protein
VPLPASRLAGHTWVKIDEMIVAVDDRHIVISEAFRPLETFA